MKVVDAIRRGFEIANGNVRLVLVVFAFTLMYASIMALSIPHSPIEEGDEVAVWSTVAAMTFVFFLAGTFLQGGVLCSVKDILMENKLYLGRLAHCVTKFYARLLGLNLVTILIINVIAFIAISIITASPPTQNAAIITMTTITELIIGGVGLYLMVLLLFSPYILVMDDAGMFQSIAISMDLLGTATFFKVLGRMSLLVLIGVGMNLTMATIVAMLSLAFDGKVFHVLTGILKSGVTAYLVIMVSGSLAAYYLAMKGADAKQPKA
jgi:hypothetical protein